MPASWATHTASSRQVPLLARRGRPSQARAATAEVERERQELRKLLATGGTKVEQDLLSQFSEAFGNLQRIDEEVLRLAVKNTNLKAYVARTSWPPSPSPSTVRLRS